LSSIEEAIFLILCVFDWKKFNLVYFFERWKKYENGQIKKAIMDGDSQKPVLEFIAIQRKGGSQEWAIPGVFILFKKKKILIFFFFN
jgi:hypothetical protein